MKKKFEFILWYRQYEKYWALNINCEYCLPVSFHLMQRNAYDVVYAQKVFPSFVTPPWIQEDQLLIIGDFPSNNSMVHRKKKLASSSSYAYYTGLYDQRSWYFPVAQKWFSYMCDMPFDTAHWSMLISLKSVFSDTGVIKVGPFILMAAGASLDIQFK